MSKIYRNPNDTCRITIEKVASKKWVFTFHSKLLGKMHAVEFSTLKEAKGNVTHWFGSLIPVKIF